MVKLRSILLLTACLLLAGGLHGQTKDAQDTTAMNEPEMQTVFEFGPDEASWPSIDDVVMGGVSRSEMTLSDGVAIFQGRLSLENNGGFASVRSRPIRRALPADVESFVLRVRGDGRTYGFRLRTNRAFDGVSYQVQFPTRAEEWTEVSVGITELEPVFRGRLVRGYAPLRVEEIQTFGFILADKNPGEFRLEIDWIRAISSR